MEVSVDELKALVSEAFRAGYVGTMELEPDVVEELIQGFRSRKASCGFRAYSITELKDTPLNTLFEHEQLGRGWVVKGAAMEFESGVRKTFTASNQDLWDKRMKMLYESV